MESFKCVHCADLGLRNLPYGGINTESGLNRRFEDVLNNMNTVVSTAVKEGVKYFIIAGDINEERNPESILIEKFSGVIADLISQGIKVIIVAGNHDLDSAKGTSTSISYIKSLGLIDTYVADLGPETFEFDDVVFHCVPTMYPSQLDLKDNIELTNYLDDMITKIELHDGKANILVSHYSLENTFEGLDVDEAFLKLDTLARFDYVALGHIHRYEMFSSFNGGYPGSLFVKDFGEAFEKFFNILEVNPPKKSGGRFKVGYKKYSVPERKFVEFELDATGKTVEEFIEEDLKSTVVGIKDAIVKLKVTTEKRFTPRLVYEYLRDQKVFHYAPIEWKITETDKTSALEVKSGMTDADVVNSFLDKQELKPVFRNSVSKYLGELIKNWQEQTGA